MLQDPGLLAINGFAVPAAKLAEKRKLIEEIAHNDVKKVSIFIKDFSRSAFHIFIFVKRLQTD